MCPFKRKDTQLEHWAWSKVQWWKQEKKKKVFGFHLEFLDNTSKRITWVWTARGTRRTKTHPVFEDRVSESYHTFGLKKPDAMLWAHKISQEEIKQNLEIKVWDCGAITLERWWKILQRAIEKHKRNFRPKLLSHETMKSVGDKGRNVFLFYLKNSWKICCVYLCKMKQKEAKSYNDIIL